MTPAPVAAEPVTSEAVLCSAARWLSDAQLDHLQRLMAWWWMLADLSFSDLLLFVPWRASAAAADDRPDSTGSVSPLVEPDLFRIAGQVRPTTSRTLYRDDFLGLSVTAAERDKVAKAYATGLVVSGEGVRVPSDQSTRVTAVPVCCDGRPVAVMSSELSAWFVRHRAPGELERAYDDVFRRFAAMIAQGRFPFSSAAEAVGAVPRVGDGLLLTDSDSAISYASPNAVSVLHRVGVHGDLSRRRMRDLGLMHDVVGRALSASEPVIDEFELRTATLQVAVLPLVARLVDAGHDEPGDAAADRSAERTVSTQRAVDAEDCDALVLLRDITELRRRDKLLISKDATIREIHHRVTNNLQTVSSLLRIQSRRLASAEAKHALDDAVRRISSIALVHRTLAGETTDDVEFCGVAQRIMDLMSASVRTGEQAVDFRISCDAGMLPSRVATPLAVVLNELLQNTIDHAFPRMWTHEQSAAADGGEAVRTVEVQVERRGGRSVVMSVADNGVGIHDDYDTQRSGGLGTSIVRALISSELGGTYEVIRRSDGPGSVATVTLPLDETARPGE